MTLAELEKRITALENTVAQLQAQVAQQSKPAGPWWVTEAGLFANDPVFDEVVRLGREYRESLHPDRKKPKKQKKQQKDAHS